MRLIIYLLVYPFLWCISMLPFRLLYTLSDLSYLIVYYLIGYRKKTVRKNIALALPHLSDAERLVIEKKSFQHLCDIFLEMIKTMNISEKEVKKRFLLTNLEVYKKIEEQPKSIAMMMAHYASYEWVISMNYYSSHRSTAIYKKIANPYFDKLVRDIRSRFKATLITTKETVPTIIKNKNSKILALYGFASDQSPKAESAYHWQKFMGIEVPVHTGAEMLSKKYNMNIMFLKVKKLKRGYYEASFEVLSENPAEVPNYEITDKFLKLVEQQIYEAPEYYLWTHKRWKHMR
ncbi:MAG TPA: lysophospholipid acyltransferase family protein [Flavobacterium sp.]|nr:lysophospholipid acyltransferase family protein [Flavobacterium sp.]